MHVGSTGRSVGYDVDSPANQSGCSGDMSDTSSSDEAGDEAVLKVVSVSAGTKVDDPILSHRMTSVPI